MGKTVIKIKDSEIVELDPPRLPYHSDITTRFGIDRGGWRVICETIFPSAKTFDAIIMALSYCKARNLDVFKRPVHIVPLWSATIGKTIETIWPGIAELRTTAARTGSYAGVETTAFGPLIERQFKGKAEWGKEKGNERNAYVKFPEWCRITVIRSVHGKERRFVGPTVYWLEAYAKWNSTETPNEMWAKRPFGQLEKCAEAAALRRAFPEEIGNELSAEEMEGQRLDHPSDAARDITPKTKDEGPPDPSLPPPTVSTSVDETSQWLRDLEGAFSGCEDASSLAEAQHLLMMPQKGKVTESAWAEAQAIIQEHIARITGDPPENDDAATGKILDAG